MSAKDGVTVRYADGSEEDYIPTQLERLNADGVERAEKVSFIFLCLKKFQLTMHHLWEQSLFLMPQEKAS